MFTCCRLFSPYMWCFKNSKKSNQAWFLIPEFPEFVTLRNTLTQDLGKYVDEKLKQRCAKGLYFDD